MVRVAERDPLYVPEEEGAACSSSNVHDDAASVQNAAFLTQELQRLRSEEAVLMQMLARMGQSMNQLKVEELQLKAQITQEANLAHQRFVEHFSADTPATSNPLSVPVVLEFRLADAAAAAMPSGVDEDASPPAQPDIQ